MAANKVISGEYKNKRVIPKQDTIEISLGLFDSLELNSSNVEKFEVITDIHRKCAIQGIARGLVNEELIKPIKNIRGDISIRNRNRNIIIVKFFNGKTSLLEVDKKRYELISKRCIEHKTKISADDLEISKMVTSDLNRDIDVFTVAIWVIAIIIAAGLFAFSANITENGKNSSIEVVAINDERQELKISLDKVLKSNEIASFISVLEEAEIEFEKISNFSPSDEKRIYSFVYNEEKYRVLFEEEEIKSLSRDFGGRVGSLNLYEEGYEVITDKQLIVSIGDKIAMSILSEEYIKLYLSNPYEAKFNSQSDLKDARYENIFFLSSSVNDKDGFGVSNVKEYYFEFKKENGIFSIIHVEIDGEIVSSEENIDLQLVRKKESDDLVSVDLITLEYNVEGQYGISIEDKVIYYLPQGKYEVKTKTPEKALRQLRIDEKGDEYSAIVTIVLSDIEASAILDITEDSYIEIAEGSVFNLYPIK